MKPTYMVAAVVLWWSALSSAAQQPRTVWDGVYTEAQADRGRTVFTTSCLRCHGPFVEGVALRFTADKFWASWGEDSLAMLYTYLRQSMPNDAPGTLTDAAYTDLVAYLVAINGAPTGLSELTSSTMESTRLTRRSGGGALPEGALVVVTGCLAKSEKGWMVTRTTAPARARGNDLTAALAEARVAPPGDATFSLLYPTSPLDSLVGHRVLVRGLLVRRPADGVNVMSVHSTTQRCE